MAYLSKAEQAFVALQLYNWTYSQFNEFAFINGHFHNDAIAVFWR